MSNFQFAVLIGSLWTMVSFMTHGLTAVIAFAIGLVWLVPALWSKP